MGCKVIFTDPKGRYQTIEKTMADGRLVRETVRLSNADRRKMFPVNKPDKFVLPKTPSPKRELHRVTNKNYLAGLMDCKVIDKFFGTEHQFRPAPKSPYLPTISYEDTLFYMQEHNSCIYVCSCKRIVYRNNEPFGCITQNILDRLIRENVVAGDRIPGSFDELYEAI